MKKSIFLAFFITLSLTLFAQGTTNYQEFSRDTTYKITPLHSVVRNITVEWSEESTSDTSKLNPHRKYRVAVYSDMVIAHIPEELVTSTTLFVSDTSYYLKVFIEEAIEICAFSRGPLKHFSFWVKINTKCFRYESGNVVFTQKASTGFSVFVHVLMALGIFFFFGVFYCIATKRYIFISIYFLGLFGLLMILAMTPVSHEVYRYTAPLMWLNGVNILLTVIGIIIFRVMYKRFKNKPIEPEEEPYLPSLTGLLEYARGGLSQAERKQIEDLVSESSLYKSLLSHIEEMVEKRGDRAEKVILQLPIFILYRMFEGYPVTLTYEENVEKEKVA